MGKRMKRRSLHIDDEQWAELHQYGRDTGTTASAIIRRAIAREIKSLRRAAKAAA